jgi:hypothetical protein
MSVYHGILNLTNWAGNVIMPTLGALFIAIAILQFARGQHQVFFAYPPPNDPGNPTVDSTARS